MKAMINYEIESNTPLTKDVYKMVLKGDGTWVENPGQFMNITIDGAYLKRPISICAYDKDSLTIIYKVVGFGTKQLSLKQPKEMLECLVGLGNGFKIQEEKNVVVIGGGVGVPPLYGLVKELLAQEKNVTVILGFNKKEEVFYEDEFKKLGALTYVATVDGSYGEKGFVTDVMRKYNLENVFYYACGPLPMLKAIHSSSKSFGLVSMEERMGCGFGACMGCSCKTTTGYKRICKDGPVLASEEILWENV